MRMNDFTLQYCLAILSRTHSYGAFVKIAWREACNRKVLSICNCVRAFEIAAFNLKTRRNETNLRPVASPNPRLITVDLEHVTMSKLRSSSRRNNTIHTFVYFIYTCTQAYRPTPIFHFKSLQFNKNLRTA